MKTVMVNGNKVNYNACVEIMDDEIREDLHMKIAPCTEQEFIDAYVIEHEKKFGEKFEI